MNNNSQTPVPLPGSVISVYTNWAILLKQIAFGCFAQSLCLHPSRHKGLNRVITRWITAQSVYNLMLLSRQSAAGRIPQKSAPKALPRSVHSTCTFQNQLIISSSQCELCSSLQFSIELVVVLHLHHSTANQPARSLANWNHKSFSRSRILWHLRNNLADSCYAFIHQCIHLTAHEYECDGWPVISDLGPLRVILPLRLMQCFLMHIHQTNEEIRSRNTGGMCLLRN